ncbi:MAG: hypothetical protein WC319_15005, partial [Candidatus Paceibacterota bacterium]
FMDQQKDKIYDPAMDAYRGMTVAEVKKAQADALLEIQNSKEYQDYSLQQLKDNELPGQLQGILNIPVIGQIAREISQFTRDEKGNPIISVGNGLAEYIQDENGDWITKQNPLQSINPITQAKNTIGAITGLSQAFDDYFYQPILGLHRSESEWLKDASPEFVAKWYEFKLDKRTDPNYVPPANTIEALRQTGRDLSNWHYIARNWKEQTDASTSGSTKGTNFLLEMGLTFFIGGGFGTGAKGVKVGADAIRGALTTVGKSQVSIKMANGALKKVTDARLLAQDQLKTVNSSSLLAKQINSRIEQYASIEKGIANGIHKMSKQADDAVKGLEAKGMKSRELYKQAFIDSTKSEIALDKAVKNLSKGLQQGKNKTTLMNAFDDAVLNYNMANQRVKALELMHSAPSAGRLAATMSTFPEFVATAFKGGFNGSESQMKKGIAMYLAAAKSLATTVGYDIFQFKNPLVIANKVATNVKHIRGTKSTAPVRIQEFPSEYRFTSGEHAGKLVSDIPEFKLMSAANKETKQMLVGLGVSLDDAALMANQVWMGRRVEKAGEVGRGVFGKKTQEFERAFKDPQMGIDKGYVYNPNHREVFIKTIQDRYMLAAEKQIANYLKESGKDFMPGTVKLTKSAVEKTVEKLRGISTITDDTKAFLGTVSVKLKNAIDSKLPDTDIQKLVQEAIDSAEAVVEKGAYVSLRGLRGAEGMKFTADQAKNIQKALDSLKSPTGILGGMLKTAQTAVALTRFTITAFDLGMPWIHGFPMIFNNSKAWAAGWKRMMKSMFSEEWVYGYNVKNKDVIVDMIKRGHMVFDDPEYMEGAISITKIPVFGKHVAKPFERAFSTGLNTARVEMYKSLSVPKMSDDHARAIGDHIDKLLGSAHASKMGLSQTQSAVAAVALFAPRYYMSCLGLYKNIFFGDMNKLQALSSVARMQAGMHLSYYAMCQ